MCWTLSWLAIIVSAVYEYIVLRKTKSRVIVRLTILEHEKNGIWNDLGGFQRVLENWRKLKDLKINEKYSNDEFRKIKSI